MTLGYTFSGLLGGDTKKFACGYCAEYAIALHEVTGHPLWVIRGYEAEDDDGFQPWQTAHAFISPDKGTTGVDVYGKRPVAEMIKDALFSVPVVSVRAEPISRKDLEAEMPIEPELLDEARLAVRRRLGGLGAMTGSPGLSATIVRRKEPRRAVVRETKQPLRAAPMPEENVVTFKMPQGYGILTASGEADSFFVYGFDTEQNAQAYYDGVKSRKRTLFLFPQRGYGRQNPIIDVWARWNRPPKGCVSILFLAAYDYKGEKTLFIDMMSTRPEWQRYGVNTAMLLRAQMMWPDRTLLFSDTTHAGHAYAEWWRRQGRQVEEQNAKLWRLREGKTGIKFKFDGLPKKGPIPASAVAYALNKLNRQVKRCNITPALLREGMTVEREHQDVTRGGVERTARIAVAHLCERKDYYKRLKRYVES